MKTAAVAKLEPVETEQFVRDLIGRCFKLDCWLLPLEEVFSGFCFVRGYSEAEIWILTADWHLLDYLILCSTTKLHLKCCARITTTELNSLELAIGLEFSAIAVVPCCG